MVLGGQVVDFEVYGPQSSSRVLGLKSEKSQLQAGLNCGKDRGLGVKHVVGSTTTLRSLRLERL